MKKIILLLLTTVCWISIFAQFDNINLSDYYQDPPKTGNKYSSLFGKEIVCIPSDNDYAYIYSYNATIQTLTLYPKKSGDKYTITDVVYGKQLESFKQKIAEVKSLSVNFPNGEQWVLSKTQQNFHSGTLKSYGGYNGLMEHIRSEFRDNSVGLVFLKKEGSNELFFIAISEANIFVPAAQNWLKLSSLNGNGLVYVDIYESLVYFYEGKKVYYTKQDPYKFRCVKVGPSNGYLVAVLKDAKTNEVFPVYLEKKPPHKLSAKYWLHDCTPFKHTKFNEKDSLLGNNWGNTSALFLVQEADSLKEIIELLRP